MYRTRFCTQWCICGYPLTGTYVNFACTTSENNPKKVDMAHMVSQQAFVTCARETCSYFCQNNRVLIICVCYLCLMQDLAVSVRAHLLYGKYSASCSYEPSICPIHPSGAYSALGIAAL